jgi:hypothetical protein
MVTEVISETSKFSEFKHLITEIKHIGHDSFFLHSNEIKTAATHNKCEGEYLSLKARKWQKSRNGENSQQGAS